MFIHNYYCLASMHAATRAHVTEYLVVLATKTNNIVSVIVDATSHVRSRVAL